MSIYAINKLADLWRGWAKVAWDPPGGDELARWIEAALHDRTDELEALAGEYAPEICPATGMAIGFIGTVDATRTCCGAKYPDHATKEK